MYFYYCRFVSFAIFLMRVAVVAWLHKRKAFNYAVPLAMTLGGFYIVLHWTSWIYCGRIFLDRIIFINILTICFIFIVFLFYFTVKKFNIGKFTVISTNVTICSVRAFWMKHFSCSNECSFYELQWLEIGGNNLFSLPANVDFNSKHNFY